jgi:cellulose synthase/poly-beta-1,6-N-acetylglucosamine synthase-like glycosyltransferase
MFSGIWESWLRAVQCYDFESSHAVDKPAFSAIGFMPVLPGPCGLFRYHEIKGSAIDRYFGFVQKDVEVSE